MQKIKQLDDVLANKIAAGEVVERPANVVKELVENSVDAGSKKITILIQNGGLTSIKIIDDGQGMSSIDAKLCFMRHATSKIRDDKDLFCIATLGFRGEAIPSIASISKFTLETSDGENGTKVDYEYGKFLKESICSKNRGTTITVEKLFQNVPARLKYMKSENTEFSAIQSFVEKIALSYPMISFVLVNNDRTVFSSSGNNNLLETISNVYGLSIAKNMIPVDFSDDEFHITGYISKIDTTRASKKDMITLVNSRVVKNQVTIDTIYQSYRKYLVDRRYPLVVVQIEIDPFLVDVNVHPSKLEVRFSKEQKLRDLLMKGMDDALSSTNLTHQAVTATKKPTFTFTPIQEELPIEYVNEAKVTYNPPVKEPVVDVVSVEPKMIFESKIEDSLQVEDKVSLETQITQPIKEMKQKIFVQGQVHGTYIVAQDDQAMYLIDQHAAQERINYEYYLNQYSKLDLSMRDLLIPIIVEYVASDCLLIEERKEELAKVGIELELFGQTKFIVKALPVWMKNIDEQVFIESMIAQLLQNNRVDVVALQEHAIATLSCKASLKANQHLTQLGMQTIVDRLMCCDNPYVCPHGRPTVLRYSTYEMEKMFKRVT